MVIRAFLISSAARGLLLGINGLLDYRAISIPLQFTPLNAAFVAGLYLAGTIGLIDHVRTRARRGSAIPDRHRHGYDAATYRHWSALVGVRDHAVTKADRLGRLIRLRPGGDHTDWLHPTVSGLRLRQAAIA